MTGDGYGGYDDPVSAEETFTEVMNSPEGQAIRASIVKKMNERIAREEEEARNKAKVNQYLGIKDDKPTPPE